MRRRAHGAKVETGARAAACGRYDRPMTRPLPTTPRGPRRRRRADADRRLVLACPRVAPDWELGALRVLMKPHDWTRGAIEHRTPVQPWPPTARRAIEAAREDVAQRLDFAPDLHFPDGGDFYFVAEYTQPQLDAARALALVISRRLPGVWLALDRLFVRDGRFFRRERGYKFDLVEATNVHLSRATRAALKGLA
jgi:hypothetical protein